MNSHKQNEHCTQRETGAHCPFNTEYCCNLKKDSPILREFLKNSKIDLSQSLLNPPKVYPSGSLQSPQSPENHTGWAGLREISFLNFSEASLEMLLKAISRTVSRGAAKTATLNLIQLSTFSAVRSLRKVFLRWFYLLFSAGDRLTRAQTFNGSGCSAGPWGLPPPARPRPLPPPLVGSPCR